MKNYTYFKLKMYKVFQNQASDHIQKNMCILSPELYG